MGYKYGFITKPDHKYIIIYKKTTKETSSSGYCLLDQDLKKLSKVDPTLLLANIK